MSARMPLARRIVFADPRRAALATGGWRWRYSWVLVLDGIFAGAMRQVTNYLRESPADVIVSQRGVRTMPSRRTRCGVMEMASLPFVGW
jgi:hypothetical protein